MNKKIAEFFFSDGELKWDNVFGVLVLLLFFVLVFILSYRNIQDKRFQRLREDREDVYPEE